MSTLGILVFGIIVSTIAGFGAYLIGLQEDGDSSQRGDAGELRLPLLGQMATLRTSSTTTGNW